MHSQAFVNKLIVDLGYTKLKDAFSFMLGVTLLSLLAQIAIPLSWTPVPITGQTFGVTLVALLWGQKRAFGIVSAYLIIGTLGLPVFAIAGGASWGYLLGMLASTLLVGHLADRGWTHSLLKCYLAGFLGSCVTFACGLSVLAFFIPADQLLIAGLLPFLPGDFIKTMFAASIANSLNRYRS